MASPSKTVEFFHLKIERLNPYGVGVAFRDGLKHLVPGTLPGEEVEAVVLSKRKDAVACSPVRITKTHPERVAPACPLYGSCGGCDLQHASYPEQLRWKSERVRELFGARGETRVEPIVPAPEPYGYRNRVTLHHDGNRIGFHRANSREIVPTRSCPIASAAVNAKIAALGETPMTGPESFEIREDGGNAFVQVNSAQNANLIAQVSRLTDAKKTQRILELFAGAGNFTFALAGACREIVAVEGNPEAVATANRSRKERGIKNASFSHEPVHDAVFRLAQDCASFDAVVCDPPREGLRETAALLPRLNPRRIVYVSCEPKSLIKDAGELKKRAYRLSSVVPVDMFPQTRHVEIVALFEKP